VKLFEVETAVETKVDYDTLNGPLGDHLNTAYFDTVWAAHTNKEAGVLATTVFDDDNNPEADLRFNTENYTYGDALTDDDSDANRVLVDLQSVALHEVGHLLGLSHAPDSDTDSAMTPTVTTGKGAAKRVLSAGDVERLKVLVAPFQ
jgi:hypothetical protein